MSKETTQACPSPPKKASALLRLAVADAKKIEKMKTRHLDMSEWHKPLKASESPTGVKSCGVCMAGAIMDRTLKLNHQITMNPMDLPLTWDRALNDVDEMRTGHLWLESEGCFDEGFEEIVKATYCHDSGRATWKTYLEAADYLESKGY